MYKLELIDKEKIEIIIPLLKTLNAAIEDFTLKQRLEDMKARNYECLGVFDNGKLIGICGLWILNKYYVGKHIEPDNVVIMPEYRGQKIGEAMMQWIYDYAKQQGCIASELNVYVTNPQGLKFWMNQGYNIIGFHCQKKF